MVEGNFFTMYHRQNFGSPYKAMQVLKISELLQTKIGSTSGIC